MLPTRQPAIGTFMNKMKYSDDLQGTCNRSIHLLELRFHWSIQVDFMRHVICMSIARVTSVTAHIGEVEVCHSNEFVAAWIEKPKLESR